MVEHLSVPGFYVSARDFTLVGIKCQQGKAGVAKELLPNIKPDSEG
jgi:hypothetical protein